MHIEKKIVKIGWETKKLWHFEHGRFGNLVKRTKTGWCNSHQNSNFRIYFFPVTNFFLKLEHIKTILKKAGRWYFGFKFPILPKFIDYGGLVHFNYDTFKSANSKVNKACIDYLVFLKRWTKNQANRQKNHKNRMTNKKVMANWILSVKQLALRVEKTSQEPKL